MKHVAVVGASGAVGERMIRLLEERCFPLASIKFLASAGARARRSCSAARSTRFASCSAEQFAGVEIVLSSTPASVSREWSPRGRGAGAVVVDNSSASAWTPTFPWSSPRSTRTTS